MFARDKHSILLFQIVFFINIWSDVHITSVFVTYEWAQKARVFVTGKPFQPNVMKHCRLSSQFVSYGENEVLYGPNVIKNFISVIYYTDGDRIPMGLTANVIPTTKYRQPYLYRRPFSPFPSFAAGWGALLASYPDVWARHDDNLDYNDVNMKKIMSAKCLSVKRFSTKRRGGD